VLVFGGGALPVRRSSNESQGAGDRSSIHWGAPNLLSPCENKLASVMTETGPTLASMLDPDLIDSTVPPRHGAGSRRAAGTFECDKAGAAVQEAEPVFNWSGLAHVPSRSSSCAWAAHARGGRYFGTDRFVVTDNAAVAEYAPTVVFVESRIEKAVSAPSA
jgi:hypothetical protein